MPLVNIRTHIYPDWWNTFLVLKPRRYDFFSQSKMLQTRTCCIAHGTLFSVMWQPGQERSLGENGCMYMYGWVPFFFFFSDSFIWNYQDIVNQLYPNTIKSLTEKIWLQSPLRRGSLEVGEWGHLPAHSAQLEMWNYMWLSWIASHDFNLFDLGMNFLQKTWLFLFLKTPQLC